jgi:hypothetical protein
MDLYEQIKSKGFYHFNDPRLFKYLTLYYKLMLPWDNSTKYPLLYPISRVLLRLAQRRAKKLYLSEFKTSYGGVDGWRGVDGGTDTWHNDLVEGSNTAFLLYLTTMTRETGGAIQFRTVGSTTVRTIYPKKYDVVVMDQSEMLQHRVIPLKKSINRDVAHFEFNILER